MRLRPGRAQLGDPPEGSGSGHIHHSDRGSPYASERYRDRPSSIESVASMSRKGDCWDNAVAESFFATLKKELVHQCQYADQQEARASIFEYIEVFYNRIRRHSSLGGVSPEQYEEQA